MNSRFPNIPLIMLGFSLGSFILRTYNIKYPNKCKYLFYVGTGQPENIEIYIAKIFIHLFGGRNDKPSKTVYKMAFERYNRTSDEDIDCAWLIANPTCRDQYQKDPKIRKKMTPGFFLEFLSGMMQLNREERYLDSRTPVLFLSGDEDPVAGKNQKGFQKVYHRYIQKGIKCDYKIIPGYRHDLLHDDCKKEIWDMIKDKAISICGM